MNLITVFFVDIIGILLNASLLYLISTDKTNALIEKIPQIVRWFLVPIYAVIGLTLCEAIIRFGTGALSIFWSNQDSEFNILINGYALIPFLGTYGLAWCTFLMAPNHKVNAVITLGSIYVIWIIFIYFSGGFVSDVIVEKITRSEEVSLFSSTIRMVFILLGLWIGIKSAKNNSFWNTLS